MADEIILHHYDTSPFSEKVRVFLGMKRLAGSMRNWRAGRSFTALNQVSRMRRRT